MTVIDVSVASFEAEVLDRSHELPVVVDFWAPWCGPCRKLGPALEKAAAAREGKVVLAKINTDENQRLSELYDIQGIPAVKAFHYGNVVAEFVGAIPAAQVEQFFAGLVVSETTELLEAGDEASLRRAVEIDPKNPDAAFALAQFLHRAGDPDGALEVLRSAPGKFREEGLASRIALERDPPPGVPEAFAKLDAGELEAGIDGLFELLASNRADADDLRRVIVAILDGLGVEHPLSRETRRRLAAALY